MGTGRGRSRALALAAAALALGVAIGARYGAVYVSGGSMEPAMSPGDLVLFSRGAGGAGEGDAVLVEREGWPAGVVHRVVLRRVDGSFVTRGDANPIADLAPVPPGSVQGVVFAVVPSGKALRSVVGACAWCYNRLPIAHEWP